MHGVRIRIIVVVVHAREPLERRVRRSQDMELLAYHTRTNGEITPDERQRRNVLVNRLSPNEFLIGRDIPYLEPAEIVRRRERSAIALAAGLPRSEEHTSELQSLMRISYAVFCLKKNT